MSPLIGRKCSCGLGPAGDANRVRRFYRLLPRRVKSDRLLDTRKLLLFVHVALCARIKKF